MGKRPHERVDYRSFEKVEKELKSLNALLPPQSSITDAAGAALKGEPTNSTALVVLGALMEKTNPGEALV